MEDGSGRWRNSGLLNTVCRMLTGRRKMTEEDIQELIEEGKEDGVVGEEEQEMIRAIFALDSTVAREIMVPRTSMATISTDASVREIIDTVISCGHSRLPVFSENLDNIVGLLYAKDLLKCWGMQSEQINIRKLLRQPFFTPETKNLEELLQEFRKTRVHMAIVLDEYGGTAGLVTIEDLLEQIVGDIQDEYDVDQVLYNVGQDGALIADARLPVEELEERFGMSIERDQFDTVGGLVTLLADGIPAVGAKIFGAGLEFEVLDADPRRVKKLKIHKPAAESETA